MKYQEMDLWKASEFNFLNEEEVNTVINNEQILRKTAAFVANLGAVVSFEAHAFLLSS